MSHYDVFNGDADGICSLLQLRLHTPKQSTLVTGVKRDIDLLSRLADVTDSSFTVLDISMDKNNKALLQILDGGSSVEYFDHHFPGEIPAHPALQAAIDTDAEICTGLLVNQHLQDAYLPWAVTAAFGDNLHRAATTAAAKLDFNEEKLAQLEELGTLLNYNGYGATVEDLFFSPDNLFQRLLEYPDPFDFIAQSEVFDTLRSGYASDMDNARAVEPQLLGESCATFTFPMQRWARRVGGVYGNELARAHPDRAHALLSEIETDVFQVSVRAPINRREGADELCRQFDTGGGRKAAAGINRLPKSDIPRFNELFQRQFSI
jgi:hypothetical protein